MAIRKSNAYLALVNSYMIDSPQPSSINYWWNVGSLLGLCLVIQIASGIFLAMHYSSHIELAFDSVEHIMRDVNAGWLIRYIHANGASFFFICLYLHIGKALYYGSYRAPRVTLWTIGVIIFILTIATAFMGYKNNSPKSFYCQYNWDNYKQNRIPNKFINLKYHKRYYSINVKSNQDLTKPEDIFNEIGVKVEHYWIDLHKHDNRSKMITDLKNKGGIYIIINKISHNYYIGSASIDRLYTRFSNHMLNFHGSKIVKKAVLKDGLNNFIFGILEYYPVNNIGIDSHISSINLLYNEYRHNLFELETMYISLLTPNYNILTEAGSSIGYKHTDETIEKLKSSFTKKRRLLLSQLQSSRKNNWSEISKQKLRNIALNRPLNYISIEGKNKISIANSIIIKLYDNKNNYICEFKNINTISHYLCCSYKTIQRSLNIGWIYIPNIFINYLNNDYINNNNDFITDSNISNNKNNIYYINSRNKKVRVKSGLHKYDWNTKFIIKR